jgi:hypothetical protein
MTLENETRERALASLEIPLAEMPRLDLATMASERLLLVTTAKAAGRGLNQLLDELWSSDVTEMRAASLVEAAQKELVDEHYERERKKNSRKGRR